jgi:hypothetical protein
MITLIPLMSVSTAYKNVGGYIALDRNMDNQIHIEMPTGGVNYQSKLF